VVVALARRAEAVAGAEAGAGAAYVDGDEGVAARDEEVAPAGDAGGGLGALRGVLGEREAAVVGVKIRMVGTRTGALGGR
jgi:hypothetical protein